jgi:hypothetical protein
MDITYHAGKTELARNTGKLFAPRNGARQSLLNITVNRK